MSRKRKDRVTEYAQKVVAGQIKCVGSLHVKACKRHLRDLERQGTRSFPFYWDQDEARRVIDYAETLTIAEGTEPKPVKLLDCQAFDIGATFGWRKVSDHNRRFRRRYKSMARQNGKTFENGILGTYIAGFGGYNFGKLFTVATKKRQARLAWEEMAKFVTIDPDLAQLFTVKDYKSLIEAHETNCTIEALSKEAGLDDGFRSIFSSIDELHQHKDNKIYKALYNGTRGLPETLVSMITTRGDRVNSFCKEMDDYCVNILDGNATAEDFFVDIYSLDEGDDIWDPNNWAKANPYLVKTKQGLQTLKTDARTAKDMGGSELKDFLTKGLNIWVQHTDDQFIETDRWQACGSERTLEDFRGKDVWVGLDLSSGGDLTSLAIEVEEPEGHYYFHTHSFMPRGRIDEHIETDLAPYDLWEQMELITVTGGRNDYKNDYKFIIRYLADLKERYELNILGIGIDPHNADGILADLEELGAPVIVVTQSARSLNDATVDIRLSVKSGAVEYNRNNELMTWSFVNASIVRNSFDEIKVDKKPGQNYKRIDVVDACIDAHAVLLKNKAQKPPVDIETEMDKYLAMMGWLKP